MPTPLCTARSTEFSCCGVILPIVQCGTIRSSPISFRSWNQVADARVEEVEVHIRVSGRSRIKAPRIQSILRRIRADRGKIDLRFLKDMNDQAAYEYLRAFPGVGPKTAHCMLLFSFG